MEKIDYNIEITDTIMAVPKCFKVGDKMFYLYPTTLGKTFLLQRVIKALGMDVQLVSVNPMMEALRLCREKAELVCKLITYHTINKKKELFDSDLLEERISFFGSNLTMEEMAELFILCISDVDVNAFIHHLGIDKEKEWQKKAMSAKKDSSSLTFGGKSVYGTLIDGACERYGWTFEYVVWGISYANLQLLLADSITSVFLTDEERKKVRIPKDRDGFRADDPKNNAAILAMDWS